MDEEEKQEEKQRLARRTEERLVAQGYEKAGENEKGAVFTNHGALAVTEPEAAVRAVFDRVCNQVIQALEMGTLQLERADGGSILSVETRVKFENGAEGGFHIMFLPGKIGQDLHQMLNLYVRSLGLPSDGTPDNADEADNADKAPQRPQRRKVRGWQPFR